MYPMIRSLPLLICLLACQNPDRKATDDSELTEIQFNAPNSRNFKAGSPEEKLKTVKITAKHLETKDERYACKSMQDESNSLEYSKNGSGKLSFSLLQNCSYTFTMELVGDSAVYYEGSSEVLSTALKDKASLLVKISLNLTQAGAAAGFGTFAAGEDSGSIAGDGGSGPSTKVSLESQLGSDSCNVSHLLTFEKGSIKMQQPDADQKKVQVLGSLRYAKDNEKAEFSDIQKALAEACSSNYTQMQTLCEVAISVQLYDADGRPSDKLNRTITTAPMALTATSKIAEIFVLKSSYSRSTTNLKINFCLARR